MSEENKKRNPEMNEQALEGVSGGYGLPSDPVSRANEICLRCPRPRDGRCSKSPSDLADYMREHGLIDRDSACPFYH